MRRFLVTDDSMSPALKAGRRIAAVKLRRPERGAVVFFPHPLQSQVWLVKRIVGLPREKVELSEDGTIIDGDALPEPWTIESTEPYGSWIVPEGMVFVLSDARHRTTADSRSFGPVSTMNMYRSVWPVP